MVNEDNREQGPRLVWTFPLITRVQTRTKLLSLGSNIERFASGSADVEDVDEDKSEESSDGSIEGVEEEINAIKDSSDLTFGSGESNLDVSSDGEESNDEVEVSIRDGVFVPTKAEISVGDTIKWVNEDDQVHRISSIEGESFSSDQLETEDSFEHTFEEPGVTVYVDSITGGSEMSGAVIVGDADSQTELPSKSDTEPELFEEEDSSIQTRSMSTAASDKGDMDIGFSD